jgi:hypothetical protein
MKGILNMREKRKRVNSLIWRTLLKLKKHRLKQQKKQTSLFKKRLKLNLKAKLLNSRRKLRLMRSVRRQKSRLPLMRSLRDSQERDSWIKHRKKSIKLSCPPRPLRKSKRKLKKTKSSSKSVQPATSILSRWVKRSFWVSKSRSW